MTGVNQESVIIMNGQGYVSSSGVKATSSSMVKATASGIIMDNSDLLQQQEWYDGNETGLEQS